MSRSRHTGRLLPCLVLAACSDADGGIHTIGASMPVRVEDPQ